MEILLQTDNTMLIDKDGRLEMLPNNDYTRLRFVRFGGGRIHHDFGDGCVIQETYNRGIYNCECDGELMQVYDGGRLARAVLDGDADAYRDIFSEMYSEKMEAAVVDMALAVYGDRVRRDTVDGKAAYVVDETWAVGEHGGAMYRKKDGDWHPLCLVADPTGARTVVLPGHAKPVDVKPITWIVIAKVLFLLFPRPEGVFMGQLPGNLKRLVLDAHAGQAGGR